MQHGDSSRAEAPVNPPFSPLDFVFLARRLQPDVAFHSLSLIAPYALQLVAKEAGTALRREHPRAERQGWVVPDVLPVPAAQLGNPIARLILVKADDGLFHRTGSLLDRDDIGSQGHVSNVASSRLDRRPPSRKLGTGKCPMWSHRPCFSKAAGGTASSGSAFGS